ncbi:heme ABC transporter ATP-binding protein [Sediminibacterium goheungense]|uniref:Iron complex transport system ATP-binding protein n=1 Tax=Sediminibacterium goheungense TaxID=1086393 RepID=A0A4R6IWR6_9BACT|nr:heme ABC transporter ATP-binding protein [Sediminibacterium goheungense]TDO27164.1 iron complex transport system ATP-binding protein [Sediminibacterium goheungense]
MITVHQLNYSIGNKVLLQDINLRFEAGKISLIIGANGAGKSTLLKTLCRQLIPVSGEIKMGHKPLSQFGNNELARIRAVLSQHIDLAFPLRVEEVVMMGRYPHFNNRPDKIDYNVCKAALESFDLSAFADRNYLTLSGGEKQLVHFARVMAQTWHPQEGYDRYLLLDEPLTFLDIQHQYQFMKMLLKIARENRVIVGVVHDLNLAAQFADHLVLLHQGKILASGTPTEVLTISNITTAFNIKPVIQEQHGKPLISFSV